MQRCAAFSSGAGVRSARPACVRAGVASRSSTVSVVAVQDVKGKVVATNTPKTVVVEVQRLSTDVTYLKRKNVTKRYMAHDEKEVAQPGDFVRLSGVRPMSRTKRFTVAEVLRAAE